MKKLNKKWIIIIVVALLAVIGLVSGGSDEAPESTTSSTSESSISTEASTEAVAPDTESTTVAGDSPSTTNGKTENGGGVMLSPGDIDVFDVPAFSGSPYVAINNNVPGFSDSEITDKSYETYGALDSLGRCTVAYACLGKDIMPTEERGSIGQVKPSGWHTVKYDCVDGKYLYNRCHLIGFQLSGENANTKNLITGTRYMNVDGMLPFENMVADYIKETNNHVMYRVTPVFDGNNLVASGVQIEAYSVEDEGDGICFNVYCYNNQPGVEIDYSDGSSKLSSTGTTATETTKKSVQTEQVQTQEDYILNTNTKKFHNPGCRWVKQMKDSNKEEFTGSRDEVIKNGYKPCGTCKP